MRDERNDSTRSRRTLDTHRTSSDTSESRYQASYEHSDMNARRSDADARQRRRSYDADTGRMGRDSTDSSRSGSFRSDTSYRSSDRDQQRSSDRDQQRSAVEYETDRTSPETPDASYTSRPSAHDVPPGFAAQVNAVIDHLIAKINEPKKPRNSRKSSSQNRGPSLTREQVLTIILGGMYLIVLGRLGYLQGCATGDLATKAATERTAHIVLPHRRGAIYDREGNVLARSVDATTVCAHPNKISDRVAVANAMATTLGGDPAYYVAKLDPSLAFCYIAKRTDPAAAQRLKDMEFAGLEFIADSKRVYPNGDIAGTVIGVVGEDGHGLTGLELEYDDVLSGTDGKLTQERGRGGEPIVNGTHERIDPIDGQNIVVSIDMDIQRVAQEQLEYTVDRWYAQDGCIVVLDPRSGEILACASTPYLDPSNFSQAPAEAFNLKCVSSAYEPGSTYKPITAAAAIDLGVATPDTWYWCPATIEVGDSLVGDSDNRDYDIDMTLRNILERSSNVGAVLCADSYGPTNFAYYVDKFHIGQRMGVDYPGEIGGIVPKLREYTGAWEAMAFGQSLAVTPLQMARAIGAIANEGIMQEPHFLLSKGGEPVKRSEGERVISTAAAGLTADMMRSVIENGYGITGYVDGYHLSGKTGTSERVDPTTGLYSDDLFTTSFIGFGPTEDPKVLTYILVDYVPNGLGSEVAGEPWGIVMETALQKLQVPPLW